MITKDDLIEVGRQQFSSSDERKYRHVLLSYVYIYI